MVVFEPLKEEDFPAYWKYTVESWMRDMLKAGLLEEGTTYEEAEKRVKQFMPEGMKTPGHYFMNIIAENLKIGKIWLEIRGNKAKEGYIWDIIIEEEYRGKGYGKETMAKVDEFVKEHGGEQISLNVFGYNSVARALYQKSGYTDAAITMVKFL